MAPWPVSTLAGVVMPLGSVLTAHPGLRVWPTCWRAGRRQVPFREAGWVARGEGARRGVGAGRGVGRSYWGVTDDGPAGHRGRRQTRSRGSGGQGLRWVTWAPGRRGGGEAVSGTEASRESVCGRWGGVPAGPGVPRCREPAGLRTARSAAAPGAARSCLDGDVHAQRCHTHRQTFPRQAPGGQHRGQEGPGCLLEGGQAGAGAGEPETVQGQPRLGRARRPAPWRRLLLCLWPCRRIGFYRCV